MKIQVPLNSIFKTILLLLLACGLFIFGFVTNSYYSTNNNFSDLLSPFVESGKIISKPLLQYSISNLQKREYQTTKIVLEEILAEEDLYTSFLFSYKSGGKKITGQINIPDSVTANPTQSKNAIILLRGYVPLEIYTTGVGTKNAAASLANAGYITVSPDFLGYGGSDPEPEDTWQTRFEKPIFVVELIKALETNGVPLNLESQRTTSTLDLDVAKIDTIGMWAHSNGGQIAITALEILQKPIPTTLWAPVTAPFPYSILYFSDELEDEGKEQRKWISLFEDNYDVFEFSHTQHLSSLTGPIQIQHGDNDDAALIYWSQEFVDKVEQENKRREELLLNQNQNATSSALAEQTMDKPLDLVEIQLIVYPNTNHNMVPSWDKAIQRDIQFFAKWLK